MRAVESALSITIPENARIIRNIITAIQFVQDHVIHFYHLHALDWVNIVNALSADPKKTADLAHTVGKAYAIGGPWPNNSEDYFASVKAKLKEFVGRGQLGRLHDRRLQKTQALYMAPPTRASVPKMLKMGVIRLTSSGIAVPERPARAPRSPMSAV
ncbi:hypothetical protein LCGC14_1997960, partial [marine sediment metagenome]